MTEPRWPHRQGTRGLSVSAFGLFWVSTLPYFRSANSGRPFLLEKHLYLREQGMDGRCLMAEYGGGAAGTVVSDTGRLTPARISAPCGYHRNAPAILKFGFAIGRGARRGRSCSGLPQLFVLSR